MWISFKRLVPTIATRQRRQELLPTKQSIVDADVIGVFAALGMKVLPQDRALRVAHVARSRVARL